MSSPIISFENILLIFLMDTITLCRLACSDKCLKKEFCGVFSSDTLPKKKGRFNAFIVNLDSKKLPGSHWICIYFKENTAYYFDSYGLPPRNRHILFFMKRNSKTIKYNNFWFQDDFSTTCGYFSLYFLHQCVRNLRKKALKTLHPRNRKFNESFIKDFVKKNFFLSKCCRHHVSPTKKQSCVALTNMKIN